MVGIRKIAAILVSDVVGYSRLTGTDEDRILARLRTLRSDLIDPTIAVHNGRVVKRTGDGSLVEFRSVGDAVRCAIEMQDAMVERNAGMAADRRIEFRIGIHLGEVVEEPDGDLMGDSVNIAARLEGIAAPGAICLSEDAYRQVKGRLEVSVSDLGPKELRNIAEPVRVYLLHVGQRAPPRPTPAFEAQTAPPRLSIVVLPFANISADPAQEHFVDGVTESLTTDLSRVRGMVVIARNTAFAYKGKPIDAKTIGRELNVRYVLEGSVQRSGGRMRVNVQLIDAEAGHHLWAENRGPTRRGSRPDSRGAPRLLAQEGLVLTESQLAALEKAKSEKEAHGEFESECPGYCGAQDTFYVGNMKGVGRIYQQTFIDTYAKVAFAKLYDRKTPITAADLLNDRVVPFYDAHEVKLCRVLTDRGTEYCGNPEHHEYELYLALEDVDHSRTKTKSPQTNGIVERFHKTVLDEFYRVAFRKKIYGSIGELQSDLDDWVKNYNEERPHQGRWCFGKTPMQTFLDATPLAKEKMIAA